MTCGSCTLACPQSGISRGEHALNFDRALCTGCFTCVRACPTGAAEAKGREIAPEDLAGELLKDRAYFGEDGGVTLSGGEALLQAESVELLRLLKEAGVGTAVDTCGQIPPETLSAALEYADIVLYDVKIADSRMHKKFTGTDNSLILENLKTVIKWAGAGAACSNGRLWIRTPIIPGATDSVSNIADIARFLTTLPGASHAIERWELTAFNNLCSSKYESMGEVWQYKDAPLKTEKEMDELLKAAQSELPGTDIRTTGMTAKE
jgi:pyruvate formate lyase activating enzyme